MDDAALQSLAGRVAAALLARGHRLATAESCTGGYVAKLLTDVPGSSRWFDAGYVTYSNGAKQRDLGVSAATLLAQGAVSEAAVREMAAGALRRTGADVVVAISGVAGPDGGTVRNPVGSVWFAFARRSAEGSVDCRTRHERFDGDRDAVRRQAAARALQELASA